MKKNIKTAAIMIGIFTLLLGVIYPLFITAIAQIAFNKKANGSLLELNGKTIGSENVGQVFTERKYFHTRPSSVNYDSSTSGGYNYGPLNEKLTNDIQKRIDDFRALNDIPKNIPIPADIVTASSSGLDPNISVEAAYLQAKRIAEERQMTEEQIKKIIDDNTENKILSGTKMINVLKVNAILDNTK